MGSKPYFALLSVCGFAVGIAILYFLRPGMTVRTVIVSISALGLICAILLGGDLFADEIASHSGQTLIGLKDLGWFCLGLLFSSGRGDVIVSQIDKHLKKQ
ncbi:MAG: hypothetical protein J0H83_08565 [Candidatus Melainabacteria bacterium]|nr:hypothetical protein [Candidatus Melainabacteria bacterium]